MKEQFEITLKNINKFSLQEIFNKAANHLLTQNKKSRMNDGLFCLYKGPGDLKCAVGCFITDKMYSQRMEGKSVFELVDIYKFKIEAERLRLLHRFQDIHDNFLIDFWRDELNNLADLLRLNRPS